MELSLSDLLYFLMRKKWLILLVTVAAAAGGYFYSYATHVPHYSTTATMVFNVTQQSNNALNTTDTFRLVDTFLEIVKSDRGLREKIGCNRIRRMQAGGSPRLHLGA